MEKSKTVIRSRLKELLALKERKDGYVVPQKEIAEITGLNPNTIGRWMQPTPFAKIEAEAAIALCEYLNCGLGDLLYLDHGQ